MSNQTLETKTNISLIGKIACDNHFVLVCDASIKALTVNLPDSKSVKNICIVISKKDSTSNFVTAQCDVVGQQINGDDSIALEFKGDSMQLFATSNGYIACRSREVSRFS